MYFTIYIHKEGGRVDLVVAALFSFICFLYKVEMCDLE